MNLTVYFQIFKFCCYFYGVSVDEGIITSLFDSIIEKNYHEVYDLLTNELFVKIVPMFSD